MASVTSGAGLVHLGMDTSMNAIVVGVLGPGEEVPVIERVFNDEASVRRLVGRFADRRVLAACYEAGPGGYELYRLLTGMGVACDVVAPSRIPKGSGDLVKSDRRDAARLARLHRAGELTAIRVPTPAEEAVRDLVRSRGDLLDDRRRTQQRLNAFLLRHGRVWRGGSKWTVAHRRWVAGQVFDEPALVEVFAAYRAWLEAREAELAVIEARLGPWAAAEPLAGTVNRLGAYRGIAALTGLTLAAEVVDWRRFASARAFMGFAGLVPTEYSSGERTRRGRITKAGPAGVRTALVEAAWAYQHRPAIGARLNRRQAVIAEAAPQTLARSWKAQQRLHATYRKMLGRGKSPGTAVVAVARELAGFVWAEMTS
jgi:transposase